MQFYYIKDEFIDFLRMYDEKVCENKKEHRPYIGIVLEIDGLQYYAPFSSPKPKHKNMKNSKDFRKIHGGIYGAINLNNMVPVVKEALILIAFDRIKNRQYRRLLQNQYKYINADAEKIKKAAHALRRLIFTEDCDLSRSDRNIKQRCCNLPLLEMRIKEYQLNSK